MVAPAVVAGQAKKEKRHNPLFVLNEMAPDNIVQLQAQWLANNDGVPPTVHQDK
jgi:hypothetical protein